MHPGDAFVISVSFVGHKVNTTKSVYKVTKGQDVRIFLFSATGDVVHVQGYDKTVTVTPGQTMQVDFIANKTGRFNVELQRSHMRLFQVDVS